MPIIKKEKPEAKNVTKIEDEIKITPLAAEPPRSRRRVTGSISVSFVLQDDAEVSTEAITDMFNAAIEAAVPENVVSKDVSSYFDNNIVTS